MCLNMDEVFGLLKLGVNVDIQRSDGKFLQKIPIYVLWCHQKKAPFSYLL